MEPHDWLVLSAHHLHVHLMILRNFSIVVDVLLFHQLLLLLLLLKILLFLLVQLFIVLLKIVSSLCSLTRMSRRVFLLIHWIAFLKRLTSKGTTKRLLYLLLVRRKKGSFATGAERFRIMLAELKDFLVVIDMLFLHQLATTLLSKLKFCMRIYWHSGLSIK